MRQRLTLCCLAVAAAFLLANSQGAQAAAWCSTKDGMSCGYYTFDQCLAAISGVGGNCVRNPREPEKSAPARSRAQTREEQKARQAAPRPEPKARQAAPREEAPSKPAKPATQTAAPAAPAAKPAPAPAAPVTAAPAKPAPAPSVTATPVAMPVGRKPAPADALVYFVGLQNGAEVPSELTLRFGVTNMGVAPAGLDNPNTGHHHVLIDTNVPALDQPIPSDFNHLHFGAGQTEAVITLPPGKHKLQLLFADENHVPHHPAVMSAPIEVIVKAKK